ncbi:hypothetical protein ACLB2K_075094 [Fragaria x ananassa]
MANYRQAKLAVDAFRGLASRIITRPEPMSRCYYTKPSFLASTKPAKRLPGFSPSFSILHNPIPQTRLQLRSYHRDGLPLVKWLHKNSSWVTLWVGVNTESKDSGVSHLTDLNWEVLVVDDTEYNAGCLPGGKIVVCSGLLKHYFSDAEIAMVIAHELGWAYCGSTPS